MHHNEIQTLFSLNELNKEQKEAVKYCDSPQLVLSGAGSGKTRVLTYKIVYLIKIKGFHPENILALTFTNRAANEMRIRISKLIDEESANSINMGTFHSIFCKILRKNISFVKENVYKSDFQIIDEDDAKKILRDILELDFDGPIKAQLEREGINDKIKSSNYISDVVRKIYEKIMILKNKGITFEEYQNLSKEIEEDKKGVFPYFADVYKTYVKKCEKKNVMDYEDLLLNTFLLFKNPKNLPILEKYQKKFKYILVDEFQDTNRVQFKILKALSWQSKKIFAVGDDCQSIYAFRGADISNLTFFHKYFPDRKIFTLCQNYRSTDNIIKIADLLIKNNKNQMKKDLFSMNKGEEKINLLINKNSFEEADKIAYIIKDFITKKKCNYSDFAILFRMNIQSFHIQKIFFKRNIPHKLCNRIGFFETKIIQNIFAYLKFIINPNLEFCLKKIINYPPRNIGEITQKKLFSLAKSKNINCWEIINNCNNEEKIKEYGIEKELKNKLLAFKELINDLSSKMENRRVYEIVYELIEKLELKKYLEKDSSSIEKINMLLDKINEMEDEYKSFGFEKYTLNLFLEQTSLLLGNEENYEKKDINDNKVKLMTIHQAKGLEFKYVFIVGLEEGFYPSYLSSFSEEEIEEERRILYVAITRAKTNCYLSYANERLMGDETKKRVVSRFIDEIMVNRELIEIYQSSSYEKYQKRNIRIEMKKKKENEKIGDNLNNNSNTNNREKKYITNINNSINNNDKDIKVINQNKNKTEIKKESKNENKQKEKGKIRKRNNKKENVINNNYEICKQNNLIIIDEDKSQNKENENNKSKEDLKEEKIKNKEIKKDKKLLNKKRFNSALLESFVIFK